MSQIRLLKKYLWALTLEWCLYNLWSCPLVWLETERSKKCSCNGHQLYCGVQPTAPAIFGRAAITLGISPHF